jgi:hypothetical protein
MHSGRSFWMMNFSKLMRAVSCLHAPMESLGISISEFSHILPITLRSLFVIHFSFLAVFWQLDLEFVWHPFARMANVLVHVASFLSPSFQNLAQRLILGAKQSWFAGMLALGPRYKLHDLSFMNTTMW